MSHSTSMRPACADLDPKSHHTLSTFCLLYSCFYSNHNLLQMRFDRSATCFYFLPPLVCEVVCRHAWAEGVVQHLCLVPSIAVHGCNHNDCW